MALQNKIISANGSNGHHKFTLTVVEESTNTANNSSLISWKLVLSPIGNGWDWAYSSTVPVMYSVTVNGVTYDGDIMSYNGSSSPTVANGTQTVRHSDDGTKSISFSFKITSIAQSYLPGSASASGSMALTFIARASQPSCITYPDHTQNVGSFGDTISIHMNRKSSVFTHRVRYAFGTLSGTCIDADTGKAATAVTTGFRWTIPASFMELLPAATKGSGTIYVDTYNGNTLVGTKYCGFTATVGTNIKPSASIQVLDNTGIKDIYGNLVKGLSKLYVKTTGTPAYKSPIKSYAVNANGTRYTAAEIVTGVLTAAGTTTVTATVTDGRGRTSAAASASFTVLDYATPAVTKLSVMRCNEDGTANKRGAYCKVTFSAVITSLNSKNTAIYYLRYKKTSDAAYTQVTLSEQTGKYTVTNYSYIFAAGTGSAYNVEIRAVDRHATASASAKCPTASSVFSWRGFRTSSGVEDGAGIGKVPDRANALQVGWETEFDKSVIRLGNKYTMSSPGTANVTGFVRMAQITITAANADTPISFVFTQRRAISPMTVHVTLNNAAATDSNLSSFTYEGANYAAFLVKASALVWDLYVMKGSEWDTITLQDWWTSKTMETRCTVTFPGDLVDTVPQGLVGYYRATPTVLRGILDSMMPVGYILLLYSHADPNDMYPGTTWVRVQNAFLWAVDGSGVIGQTGGAKEVTLTEDQIPAHTHGSVYSGNVSGTKTHGWLASGGSNMAYGTVSAGGGKAHNNMPPYIHVSVWRRTT
jgi:microcystin-dependent protein